MTNKSVVVSAPTGSGKTVIFELAIVKKLDECEKSSQKDSFIIIYNSLLNGVAYHHAGMDVEDRKLVEDAFRSGCISVLTCTSTLALGVNLPAHLVIIKNTEQLVDGELVGYSSTQLSQMVGRAGRPQFDDEAIAVIMTTTNLKAHYTKLLNECDEINSCLEPRLTEHLLCEIILKTVQDFCGILQWIKNTFFYVRLNKCPQLYDLCMKEIKNLQNLKLIDYNSENNQINPTDLGEIIFKNNLHLDTLMKMFHLSGEESIEELLYFIASCSEMNDIRLRHCEKALLNGISRAKGRSSLRFPIHARIKNASLKVVCLLQAQLGQVTINDYSLKQESEKILQSALRILNSLTSLLWLFDCPSNVNLENHEQKLNNSTIPIVSMKYSSMLSTLELRKSINFRRWLNCPLINLYGSSLLTETQIEKLIEANLLTCNALQQTECRQLENILNEQPPFGRKLLEFLDSIPKYELEVEQKPSYDSTYIELIFTISQKNQCRDSAVLLVGSAKKYLVGKWLLEYNNSEEISVITKQLELPNDESLNPLRISLISVNYGGVDLHTKYHFVSLSNRFGRRTSTPYTPSGNLIQKELSIGYTELITQQNQSVTGNVDNSNNMLNLWPEPTLSMNNINRASDIDNNNNNDSTLLNLKLPLTPIVNKVKQSNKQNLKLNKKYRMNNQTVQNQTKIHYKSPLTFTWTPTNDMNEQQSSKTPLIQTSMLDYMQMKYKDSASTLLTDKQTTKVENHSLSNSSNHDEPSVQKMSRKRFKWTPEDKSTMDPDLSQSSTFSFTSVLDEYSDTNETPTIPHILIKDNTPELFSIQKSFIKNDPLCASCPPICNGSSKLGYLTMNSVNLKPMQNQNSSFYSNTEEETQLRSDCSTKSQCLSNNYDINQVRDDEESVYYEKEQFSTPINMMQYTSDHMKLTTKAHVNEYNTVLLTDLSKSNFPVRPYTIDIANCTPHQEKNSTTYMTEVESNYNNTRNLTLNNLNEPIFNKPKDSKVLKSVQLNELKKRNECTTTQLQNKITWSKDITINNSTQKKPESQWKTGKDNILNESEKPFSIDYQLINEGWCELACLIKMAELGLLQEQMKHDTIHTVTETPKPSCSKKQQNYGREEKRTYNTNSAPTTLDLKQHSGIEMLDLSLNSDSYTKEE
ncbi:unnamed protein product [Schistosoma turkestanicum]|nr:unnamed protein product [Schistosoma turkestanicum]